MRTRLALLVLLVGPSPLSAITVLTSGKSSRQQDGFTIVRGDADPQLATPVDPTACPSAASVRIAAYPTARDLVVGPPPAALPGAWLKGDRARLALSRTTPAASDSVAAQGAASRLGRWRASDDVSR